MAANTPSKGTEKSLGGRPQSEIDWKKVDDLLMAGCMGTGIAHYLGIAPCTLYDRCLIDKGIPFSEYSQQKKEKGDEILRAHQYAKALGLTDKGDNTLLIFLGKVRLKQREVDLMAPPNDKKLDELIAEVKEQKEIDASKPETDSQLQSSEPQV